MKKITLVVLVVMVAGLVFAFGGGKGGMKGEMDCGKMGKSHGGKMDRDGMMMGRMMEELELTGTQQEKIETLNFEHKKDMIAKHADLKTFELEKKNGMKNEDFNKARKLNDKIFNLKKEMANSRLTLHENIFNQLTPEQQEKAKEMRKGRAGKKMKDCNDGDSKREDCGKKKRDCK